MSEALRDHIIDRLSSDYANGLFEVDELERRLALVHAAATPADLDAAVTDLVPTPTLALVPSQRVRVVLGAIERTGAWAVPQHLAVRVFCGHLLLDLRDAQLADTTIEVNVTMGNVEVIAPPGVAVDVDASSILGNVEDRSERAHAATRRVRIVGRVKLGNLEVSTRSLRG